MIHINVTPDSVEKLCIIVALFAVLFLFAGLVRIAVSSENAKEKDQKIHDLEQKNKELREKIDRQSGIILLLEHMRRDYK